MWIALKGVCLKPFDAMTPAAPGGVGVINVVPPYAADTFAAPS